MNSVLVPAFANQSRTIFAVISGPLSERTCIGERFNDIHAVQSSADLHGQALSRKLIDKRHQPQAATIFGCSFPRLNSLFQPGLKTTGHVSLKGSDKLDLAELCADILGYHYNGVSQAIALFHVHLLAAVGDSIYHLDRPLAITEMM